jgi:hypothetical protein
MKKTLTLETWVWAIVQNPGKNESFLGQMDSESQVKFIPAFYSKDDSLMCINLFNKDESIDYESQAVLYEDLLNYTRDNKFMIFFLNQKGSILEKVSPFDQD